MSMSLTNKLSTMIDARPPAEYIHILRQRNSAGVPISLPVKGLFPHIDRCQLAKLCEVDKSTISLILMGRRTPRMTLGVKMAAALGLTIEQLSEATQKYRQTRQARQTQLKKETRRKAQ